MRKFDVGVTQFENTRVVPMLQLERNREFSMQNWKFGLHNIPCLCVIHLTVAVDEHISESNNGSPICK